MFKSMATICSLLGAATAEYWPRAATSVSFIDEEQQSVQWVVAGAAGNKGPTGFAGKPGTRGPDGQNGNDGSDGAEGEVGQQGDEGIEGQVGEKGPTPPRAEVQGFPQLGSWMFIVLIQFLCAGILNWRYGQKVAAAVKSAQEKAAMDESLEEYEEGYEPNEEVHEEEGHEEEEGLQEEVQVEEEQPVEEQKAGK